MPIAYIPNPPAVEAPAMIIMKAAVERKMIGQAFMRADSAIVMDIRTEDVATGAVGDSRKIYMPDDPQYKVILDHLGGLKPGEVRPVMNDWD